MFPDPALIKALQSLGGPVAEGKSKTIHDTGVSGLCLMSFKPHARSITSQREENVAGTDSWRMLATLEIARRLTADGIPTHLRHPRALRTSAAMYLAVAPVRPIPIEWIVRYETAGSIVRLFPGLVQAGQRFAPPLLKYDYKQDIKVAGVDDPTLNESYIVGLGLLSAEHLQQAKRMLGAIGEHVQRYLQAAAIRLIDLKMEFGFDEQGALLLIDEISQDCIRAVDEKTGRSLTKDAFRQMKSAVEVVEAYREFALRLNPRIEELIWTIG
jgi:phosphoribosylaminoimidazole-succinocarboxamide synthase